MENDNYLDGETELLNTIDFDLSNMEQLDESFDNAIGKTSKVKPVNVLGKVKPIIVTYPVDVMNNPVGTEYKTTGTYYGNGISFAMSSVNIGGNSFGIMGGDGFIAGKTLIKKSPVEKYVMFGIKKNSVPFNGAFIASPFFALSSLGDVFPNPIGQYKVGDLIHVKERSFLLKSDPIDDIYVIKYFDGVDLSSPPPPIVSKIMTVRSDINNKLIITKYVQPKQTK